VFMNLKQIVIFRSNTTMFLIQDDGRCRPKHVVILNKITWLCLTEILYKDLFLNGCSSFLVFIPCFLLYVHERPTNALILFKVYSLSYLLLRVSASSMPSSGSLHVPTELLVPSELLLMKFYTMDGGGF
jgi:hypothetical protein